LQAKTEASEKPAPVAPVDDSILYKLEAFSKKSNVAFIRKFVVGKPTSLQLMKLTDDTMISEFRSPKEYLASTVVYFETDTINGVRVATRFGRKNAPIALGIKKIDTGTLENLLESGKKFTLVDSRPKSSYERSHIPGAISISLPQMKEQGASLLPENKSDPLVFYCGGVS
jgi:hypothetical protein